MQNLYTIRLVSTDLAKESPCRGLVFQEHRSKLLRKLIWTKVRKLESQMLKLSWISRRDLIRIDLQLLFRIKTKNQSLKCKFVASKRCKILQTKSIQAVFRSTTWHRIALTHLAHLRNSPTEVALQASWEPPLNRRLRPFKKWANVGQVSHLDRTEWKRVARPWRPKSSRLNLCLCPKAHRLLP